MSVHTNLRSIALAAVLVCGMATVADASPDSPAPPVADAVVRIGGTDRIHTAILASQAQHPGAFPAGTGTVIVARSDDFPDALAAVPLADELDAPILVTPSSGPFDERVVEEVRRLAPAHAVIVGTADVVPVDVERWLKAMMEGEDVHRIGGTDRYATAVDLAMWTISSAGQGEPVPPPDRFAMTAQEESDFRRNTPVFLATGLDYPDALAAGAAAAQVDGVVLLSKGDRWDRYTNACSHKWCGHTTSFMHDEEGGSITGPVYTVGAPATTLTFNKYPSFAGKDRYETAALVAQANFFPARPSHVTVATGEGFADAVVASAFAANLDGRLLLTQSHVVPAVTAAYLSGASSADSATSVKVFGGTGAVSARVLTALAGAVR